MSNGSNRFRISPGGLRFCGWWSELSFWRMGGRSCLGLASTEWLGSLAERVSRCLLYQSVIVTLVEFLGGIALIFGLLTRWAAALEWL